jgi:putative intracellular protease/amidase
LRTKLWIFGINNPAYQLSPGRFTIRTVSTGRRSIKAIGGLAILPDITLAEIKPVECALLILPGGPGWESGRHSEVVEKAKPLLEIDKPVAVICGATAGLAAAGLLDCVRQISNAAVYIQATQYKGELCYQEEAAVTDGNIITASAAAPIEFAATFSRN